MRIETSALSALAERTEFDIRASLHSLQFLARRAKGAKITADDVAGNVVGIKDIKRNLFEVWSKVFKQRRAKAVPMSMLRTKNAATMASVVRLV